MSRPTLSEVAWPMDADSLQQARDWTEEVTTRVLDWTWRAFDSLRMNVLARIDLTQPFEQLERDLTSKHFIEIQRIFAAETDGFSSIVPHHEFPENESRPGGSGRPPASDISFVWYENQRVSWPIEAKVIPTIGTLANYLKDTDKFIKGTTAPFASEGAQIAYLLTGSVDNFFVNLNAKLSGALMQSEEFPNRPHHCSLHKRGEYLDLRLHHLAMACGICKEQLLPGLDE